MNILQNIQSLSPLHLRRELNKTLIFLKSIEKMRKITVNNILDYLQDFSPSNSCKFSNNFFIIIINCKIFYNYQKF